MKNFKRAISLTLCIVMILGVFTGCGKKDQASVKGDGKITVGVAQDVTVPDYDANGLSLYLEEVTGLDIEWIFFSSIASNYTQQISLMCTSGEKLSDVLLGMNFGHYTVNQFGEDGFFLDLSELIETHAPNYKKALSKLTKDEQQYITEKGTNTIDGKSFYAMPSYGMEVIDCMQSMMYINKTWLDKVGMKAPTTIAELDAVCQAFATQDPNGNGKADELPMLAQDGVRNWIMNAFVEYDAANFNVKDGKVWDPIYTSEFRQGVQYINTLVKKGWCNELGFTLSNSEVKNLISPVNGGAGRVGIFAGHPEVMTNGSTDALDHYIALGALADATGKGGYNIINEQSLEYEGIITSDCADPEEAMMFLDAFYVDECVTRQRHGVKDVDWKYEEGLNSYGTKSYTKIINSQAFFDRTLNCTMGNMLGITTQWNYMPVDETAENSTNNRAIQAARLQRESWDVMQNSGKRQEGILDGLIYTTEEYEEREQKAGGVFSYISEQMVLFMKGEQDSFNDTAWKKFTSTLEDIGRGELLEIAQQAYDRKVKRQENNK